MQFGQLKNALQGLKHCQTWVIVWPMVRRKEEEAITDIMLACKQHLGRIEEEKLISV